MLPSECPYPDSQPENTANHPLGTSASEGQCSQCKRDFRRCPECQTANRWLARFCRHCGRALEARNWLPGQALSPLHERQVSWPQRWSSPLACGFVPNWAGLLDGRAFFLGKRGEVRTLARQPLGLEQPGLGNLPVASEPAYLHGYMAIPGEDQLTLIDLLDNRTAARRVQRLRGHLLCPVASDQAQWLAALVHDGDNRSLQLFKLAQGRFQLAWNQVVDGGGPDSQRIPRLFWCEDVLVCFNEQGVLTGHNPINGQELFRQHCPVAPAGRDPWVGGPQAYWSGVDGSIWRLRTRPELQLHQIASSNSLTMLSMAVGPEDLVASYGRTLLRVDLDTDRCENLELPYYCTVPPWVGRSQAVALTQEGHLYRLTVGTQTFRVESTLKLPGEFSGSQLSPFWSGRDWIVVDQSGQVFIGE